MSVFSSNRGGRQENERRVGRRIGKIHSWGAVDPLPLGSSQCHQLLLSNQWDWFNIMKDAQKKNKKALRGEKKQEIQRSSFIPPPQTHSWEEQKQELTGERKGKRGL